MREYLTATALGLSLSAPLTEEIKRARDKHGIVKTPQDPNMREGEKLAILVEEVGEVARALTYDQEMDLPKELLQVATMALLWYDCLTRLADRPTGA